MHHHLRATLMILGAAIALAAPPTARSDSATPPRLAFDVDEGRNLNSFLREGPVAAHLVLRSGLEPRILVAFPAGNSGVGLWFTHGVRPVTWKLLGPPQPLTMLDSHGRALHGISAEVSATGVDELEVKQAVLSSVRVLRDYQALGSFPAEVAAQQTVQASGISWARDRLDGAPGYRISVELPAGKIEGHRLSAASGSTMVLKIAAATGETPLTPLTSEALLTAAAAPDAAARNALTFLSYREKFLAGSWRFDTYFGRDTLMSVRLLMPALQPDAVDAGIGAVLTRLSPQGEVAHEEDIGEFAILDHLRSSGTKSDAPTFDYKMIDSTFMLAPVAAAWLLDDARGRAQAKDFLNRPDGRYGEAPRPMGADLVSNLRFVLRAAAKFVQDPRAQNLISLKPGVDVGQWRDSNTGLGGGRIPYDVNAVFVPAALEAASRFFSSGLLRPYLTAGDQARFARAAGYAKAWRTHAPAPFDVSITSAAARHAISAYAAALQIPDDAALRAVGSAPVRFHALALTADAKTVPIVHSDEGFALLFGSPRPEDLDRAVTAMMRPFPAGLLTPVGVVVANPVFASAAIKAELTSSAYHGTVIWSWQQAVLAAGLERQARRQDLPASARSALRRAQRQLWNAIDAAHAMRNSELWSWSFASGRFQIAPFGANAADADESNAAQLWSTVYLAVPRPHAVPNVER
jgi:hypothetical protein